LKDAIGILPDIFVSCRVLKAGAVLAGNISVGCGFSGTLAREIIFNFAVVRLI
jgi:hypothetical protein